MRNINPIVFCSNYLIWVSRFIFPIFLVLETLCSYPLFDFDTVIFCEQSTHSQVVFFSFSIYSALELHYLWPWTDGISLFWSLARYLHTQIYFLQISVDYTFHKNFGFDRNRVFPQRDSWYFLFLQAIHYRLKVNSKDKVKSKDARTTSLYR